MSKKLIPIVIDTHTDFEGSLEKVIKTLQEVLDKNKNEFKEIKLEYEYARYPDESNYYNVVGYRKETDEEQKKREKQEEKDNKENEDIARKQYEALKKRFEGK
jgi:hypothetical protein